MDTFKGPRLPILFLLYVDGQAPISGAIRLQKMVFLLKNEYKISKRTFTSIKFTAHKFGMYSKEIQDDIIFLENMGLISAKNRDKFSFDYLMGDEDITKPVEYSLTDKGIKFVEAVIAEASKSGEESKTKINEIVKTCGDVKQKFNSADIRDILKYVYKKYPEYTINSEILNDVMGDN